PHLRGMVLRTPGVDLSRVGRIRQNALERGRAPVGLPARRGNSKRTQVPAQPEETPAFLNEPGEDHADAARVALAKSDAGRVARRLRVQTVSVRRTGPREDQSGTQLRRTSAAHTLGD